MLEIFQAPVGDKYQIVNQGLIFNYNRVYIIVR